MFVSPKRYYVRLLEGRQIMEAIKTKSFPILCQNCKKSFMVSLSDFKSNNIIQCPYCELNHTIAKDTHNQFQNALEALKRELQKDTRILR